MKFTTVDNLTLAFVAAGAFAVGLFAGAYFLSDYEPPIEHCARIASLEAQVEALQPQQAEREEKPHVR